MRVAPGWQRLRSPARLWLQRRCSRWSRCRCSSGPSALRRIRRKPAPAASRHALRIAFVSVASHTRRRIRWHCLRFVDRPLKHVAGFLGAFGVNTSPLSIVRCNRPSRRELWLMLRPGDHIWAGVGQSPLLVAHESAKTCRLERSGRSGFPIRILYYTIKANITLQP